MGWGVLAMLFRGHHIMRKREGERKSSNLNMSYDNLVDFFTFLKRR
jgi:hypothetical protein